MIDKLVNRDSIIIDIENILDRTCNEYDDFGTHICFKCNDCEFWNKKYNLCVFKARKQALALYNAGYRKIGDDEVVIKKSNVLELEIEVFKFAYERGMQELAKKYGIDME